MAAVDELRGPGGPLTVVRLARPNVAEIVDVFSDAFRDYPVMCYVLGPAAPYDRRLGRLVELFVSRRACRNEPMLGIRDVDGTLIGAATTTLPAAPEPSPDFLSLRESVWTELSAAALARYEAFVAATEQFKVPSPHYYLDMIGVRRSHQGKGVARLLLDAVHALSESSDESSGMSLTTEVSANVGLYRHFGYHVLGQARVADGLETWSLFRQRSA